MQTFAPAKLLAVLDISRKRRVTLELRNLLNATAATCGGKAALERFRDLRRELGDKPRPERTIPLSQEDFEAMVNDDGSEI